MNNSNLTFKDLGPQDKKKLAKLIQKLKEVTDEKEKYCKLYQQSQEEIQSLKQSLKKLQKDNAFMNSQLQTSIQAINKVKSTFSAEKLQKYQKKTKIQSEWQDLQDQSQFQNQTIKEANSLLPQKPPLHSNKKNNLTNFISLNETQNGSSLKKLQIKNLKKQIKQLTEQMKSYQKKVLNVSERTNSIEKHRRQKIKAQFVCYDDQVQFNQEKITKKEVQIKNLKQRKKENIKLDQKQERKINQTLKIQNQQKLFERQKQKEGKVVSPYEINRGGFYDGSLYELIHELQKS